DIVFWYGIEDWTQIAPLVNAKPSKPAVSSKPAMPSGPAGSRGYSTMARRGHIGRRGYATASGSPLRVGLIGARGFTGRELIKLIDGHPRFELAYVSSRELAGQPVPGYAKSPLDHVNLSAAEVGAIARAGRQAVDVWILALPNGVAAPFVDAIDAATSGVSSAEQPIVVDLSADYRFDATGRWAYGLPELHRKDLVGWNAGRIANPGCYATGSQLGLAPLLPYMDVARLPSVFGVSGYSGAGTKPSPKNDPAFLADNLIPYAPVNHIHEREIGHSLTRIANPRALDSPVMVQFTPHVASFFQGIGLTLHVPLRQSMSAKDVHEVFREFYSGEKLVHVTKDAPLVRDNAGQHYSVVGGFAVPPVSGGETGSASLAARRVVLNVTLDNLLKGAATQAIQNMNIAVGIDEYTGIPAPEQPTMSQS
ncbi:hypothetical protein GGI19_006741, partial [Coemansia pectinata]